MNKKENELLIVLINDVKSIGERVGKLEESLNMGRGAFKLFLVLLSLIGTGLGAWKLFGK